MLFGSFDGIHPGHEFLINTALKYGSKIVIVVAQDAIMKKIKKRNPLYTLQIRIEQLMKRFPETTIVPGDQEQGRWSAIKQYRPETILVGYDQDGLMNALESITDTYYFSLIQADAFFPEKYKSSIINNKT